MPLPPLWLMICIAGLPLLTETVYTPCLPDIARALLTSESMAEYTLTIYLFGFAWGVLFWGKVSDRWGRKPCVIVGLVCYSLGCIGCYAAATIKGLMLGRFIQAFGGSIGSVLGQAIARDAFHGAALAKVYAYVGTALAIFPALGPVIGGVVAQGWGWRAIFLLLIGCGGVLSLMTASFLPETHRKEKRRPVPFIDVLIRMIRDKKVIGSGLLVGGCNGITFSYFAEGSFYLIEILGLSSRQYGLTFLLIAAASMVGGALSAMLSGKRPSGQIIVYGLKIIFVASSIFLVGIVCREALSLSLNAQICLTVGSHMLQMLGACMVTNHALASALLDYKGCIGTASSLFGGFYYFVVSFVTLGMGWFHNGGLLPMPLYFFIIGTGMLLVPRGFLQEKSGTSFVKEDVVREN